MIIDPHGIAFYGYEDFKIYGNTVLRNPYNLSDFESDSWFMINKHKYGRISFNNEVKINIAKEYIFISDKIHTAKNTKLDSTYNNLNNYYDWDFRVKK